MPDRSAQYTVDEFIETVEYVEGVLVQPRRFPQEASAGRDVPLPPRPRVDLPPATEIRG